MVGLAADFGSELIFPCDVSNDEQIEVSSNANSSFVRKLAQAFSMMTGLGQDNLSQPALQQQRSSADRAREDRSVGLQQAAASKSESLRPAPFRAPPHERNSRVPCFGLRRAIDSPSPLHRPTETLS